MTFQDYSEISFRAFSSSTKQAETVARKQDVIEHVLQHYRARASDILFVGFNPAAVAYSHLDLNFTLLSDDAQTWVQTRYPSATVWDWNTLGTSIRKFNLVVAVDEFLTFAHSEQEQLSNLAKLCNLSSGLVITTLRDYKNLDFKDREFSTPALVRTDNGSRIFLEHHEHNAEDRNAWNRKVYEIQNESLKCHQDFLCRNMFFKQCAKFSIDAGARQFLVHNNIMYKSMIRKNYEHVISMRFEHGHSGSIR